MNVYRCCEAGHSPVRGRDGEGERGMALSVQSSRERDHTSSVVNGEGGIFMGNSGMEEEKITHTVLSTD